MRVVAQDDPPLDHALQLPDVAGPPVTVEQLEDLVRKPRLWPSELSGEPASEVVGEADDFFAPLPQRGHEDADNVDEALQILAERSSARHGLDVPGRGGENPDVGADQLASPGSEELTVPQYVGDPRLNDPGEFADLVQEKRAAVGEVQRSRATAGRIGEARAAVAEDL